MAPVGAGVAVLGLVGLATWVGGAWRPAGVGSGEPPLLRLGTGYAAVAGDDRSGAPSGGRFVLDGTLPDEVPEDLPVYRLSAPDHDGGRALAAALGFAGAGEDEEQARVWRSGDRVLSVQTRAGGGWALTSGVEGLCVEPVPPVASVDGGTVVGCRVEPDGKGAPPTTPTTTPDEALAVAQPVLDALGLGDARTPRGAGQVVTVEVDPSVGGLPTAGATTTVAVQGSDILWANGWLGSSRAGDRYPLVSAAEAFDPLEQSPQPMADMACPEPAPGTQVEGSPLCGGQVTVTGARIGLSFQWERDRPLLVPSWLFDVEGSPVPIAQVAVHPDHLGRPDGKPVPDPGTGGGSGGSGGSGGIGGSTGTGAVEPEPGIAPPQTSSRITSVSPADHGRILRVTFWGGVEDCYAYAVSVEETPDQVLLTVEEKTTFDGACIELAQEWTLPAELAAPLGSRAVVDAETGAVLLGPAR